MLTIRNEWLVRTEPTLFTVDISPLQIDQVLTNNLEMITRSGQVEAIFSHHINHDVTFASYMQILPRLSFDILGYDLLRSAAISSWNDTHDHNSVDHMVDHFNMLARNLFERFRQVFALARLPQPLGSNWRLMLRRVLPFSRKFIIKCSSQLNEHLSKICHKVIWLQ